MHFITCTWSNYILTRPSSYVIYFVVHNLLYVNSTPLKFFEFLHKFDQFLGPRNSKLCGLLFYWNDSKMRPVLAFALLYYLLVIRFCLKHLLTGYIRNDLIPSGIGMRSIFCFGLKVSINDFCSNFCHLDTEASHFQKCCTCVHFLSRIVSHFSSCNAQNRCEIVFEGAIFL